MLHFFQRDTKVDKQQTRVTIRRLLKVFNKETVRHFNINKGTKF